jgi:hypothetical protein
MFVCKYCLSERKSKQSLFGHEWCCPSNKERKYKNGMTGKKGHNQFTKAEKLGLEKPKVSATTKEKMSKSSLTQKMSDETKQKLSAIAKERNFGGVTQSRYIKYKDKILGSSYELRLAKDLDENGIQWDVCKRFNYVDPNGKKRTYTPDFYLKDYGVYLDPKNDFLINNLNPSLGYSDLDKIKLVEEQNSIKILVLNKNQLTWKSVKSLLE